MFKILVELVLFFICRGVASRRIPIGVNLPNFSPSPTNIQAPFCNIFHYGRQFTLERSNDGGVSWNYAGSHRDVQYGPFGIPVELAEGVVASTFLGPSTSIKNSIYPLGIYEVKFVGKATFWFSGAGVNLIDHPTEGFYFLNLTSAETFLTVRIGNLNSSYPLKNISITHIDTRDSCQGSFTLDFIQKMEGFEILRFAGWQNELHSSAPNRNWSTIAHKSSIQMVPEGIHASFMVELANILNASVWFSAPKLGDFNYYLNFAKEVVKDLKSNLKIYVEYSNEVGYGDFDNQVNKTMLALQAWRQALGEDLSAPYFKNISRVQMIYSITRTEYAPHLFNQMDKFPESFQCASFIAVSGTIGQDLGFDVYDYTNAKNLTLDSMWTLIRTSQLNIEKEYNRLINFARRRAGLDVVAYRGGVLLRATTYGDRWRRSIANAEDLTLELINAAVTEQALEDFLIEYNRQPIIKDLILDFLERWKIIGGSFYVFDDIIRSADHCNVSLSRNCGNHALLESMSNHQLSQSPKFQAVLDYRNQRKASIRYTAVDVPEIEIPCSNGCVWGTCFDGNCECYSGYIGKNCSILAKKNSDCSKVVGVVAAGLADWSPDTVFVDSFKQSRSWISQLVENYGPWAIDQPINLNELDYPTILDINQAVGSMMLRDLGGHYPAGIYNIFYEGDGIIDVSLDAKVIRRDIGHILISVQPSLGLNNGIFLRIERTNPDDPIRNIRVVMPGFEKRYKKFPFHPLFLKKIERYSVIRFSEWGGFGDFEIHWHQRKNKSYRTQTGIHVSLEHIIHLSNTVGFNPWFSLPITATDDYYREYATMVRNNLRPDVEIYVEVSNEVWNVLFDQANYAQQQGILLNMSTDGTRARLCYYSWKSREVFKIWKEIFGPSQRSRLHFVLGTQSVQTAVSQIVMDCYEAYLEADHLASAPYFGGKGDITGGTNLDKDIKSFDYMFNVAIPKSIDESMVYTARQLESAKSRNLTLITYEAGQHLLGASTIQTDVLSKLNRDSRMYSAYMEYMRRLRETGVELIILYSSASRYTQYGYWGLIEGIDQHPAYVPKYKAALDFIDFERQRAASYHHESLKSVNENFASSVPWIPPFCSSGFPVSYEDGHLCVNNCSGNGLCDSDGRCLCYFGFSGEDCSNVTYIENKDCGYKCNFDNGVCKEFWIDESLFTRHWKCDCNQGWSGYYCSIPDCETKCNWNGRCHLPNQCTCYPGFKGANCEIDCGCKSHGVCKEDSTCLCDEGFKWNGQTRQCEFECNCEDSSQYCIAPGECSCKNPCVHGECSNGTCICWNGFKGNTCEMRTHALNDDTPIGMNIAGIADWSTEWPFVDLFRTARSWISQYYPGSMSSKFQYSWNTQSYQNLSAKTGYPLELSRWQILSTILCRDVLGHCPSGKYVALWDGDGYISFGFDAKMIKEDKNRIEFMYTPSNARDNGIYVQILDCNPQNPIRNLRVIMPGYEFKYSRFQFHPLFLEKMAKFGTLRFMDWSGAVSNNTPGIWVERKTKEFYTQTGHIAWEIPIELANTLAANVWLTVPLLADDEYVRNLAFMMKTELRSDSMIFVEYSNEVWNGLFDSGKYASQEGLKLNLSSDPYVARYRFYARRCKRIFQIFKSVFGVEQRRRLKLIISAFTASPWATNYILNFENVTEEADALGLALYLDCGSLGSASKASQTATFSIDQILDACFNDFGNIEQILLRKLWLAGNFSLEVVGYEFGPGLVEVAAIERGFETDGLTEKFIAANRDIRMRELYYKLLKISKSLGIHHIMHYNSVGKPTKYGSWGLWEYQDQPDESSPKYMAVKDFSQEFYVNRTIDISFSSERIELLKTTTIVFTLASPPKEPFSLLIRARGCEECVKIDPSIIKFTNQSMSYSAQVTGISAGDVILEFIVEMEGEKPWEIDTTPQAMEISTEKESSGKDSSSTNQMVVLSVVSIGTVLIIVAAGIGIRFKIKKRARKQSMDRTNIFNLPEIIVEHKTESSSSN